MNRDDVKLDESEILHDGFFRMEHFLFRHRLFGGGWSPQLSREILVRNPVAAVIPYDPVRDEIVLIEQFRGGVYAAGDKNSWSVEIVAGIIEPGETAADMAIREAKEESGCTMSEVEKILDFYPSPGGCSEVVALYWGRVSTEGVGGIHGVAEEGEDIRVFVESTDEAMRLISTGVINSSIGIIAVQWLALNRDELRRRYT
ncbi:MAG: NUDIX domain-containing protein [Rhodospirillaceae bacterium]|jgi:ADP-ribose pyrophosphatase|nr:NUDIX domain-containing protein [Rhodospirillaceae bacterium]MBT5667552.1 NUDIX domain-containing protein [Rhodospirillaceae bacterium]